MARIALVCSTLALATLGGCGGSDPVAPDSPQITIVAGNNQTGFRSTALPIPLQLTVTHSDGTPIANLNVSWAVAGGGYVSALNNVTGADGSTSVSWTLGRPLGAQSVTASVATIDPAAVFSATATLPPPRPIVLQYNGTTWRTSLADTTDVGISLSSVWGSSASQIFAVGRCYGGSLMLRYDGTSWSKPPASCDGGSLSEFTSVWGSSGTDAYAVGRGPLPPSFTDWIVRYDGSAWNEVHRKACSFCGGLRAVWSGRANDAIAVGDAGEIRRYDGTNWNVQTSGTTNNLNAVWGVGTGTAAFAAGASGTIAYYNGTSWTLQASGTTQTLNAVWGTSASDVFAVGGAGTILHYNGTAWTAQTSGSTQTLRGVWGSSGTSVFAVGDGNTVLFYNGTRWTAQTIGGSINLRGVWGSSATNVFAVGQSP